MIIFDFNVHQDEQKEKQEPQDENSYKWNQGTVAGLGNFFRYPLWLCSPQPQAPKGLGSLRAKQEHEGHGCGQFVAFWRMPSLCFNRSNDVIMSAVSANQYPSIFPTTL